MSGRSRTAAVAIPGTAKLDVSDCGEKVRKLIEEAVRSRSALSHGVGHVANA